MKTEPMMESHSESISLCRLLSVLVCSSNVADNHRRSLGPVSITKVKRPFHHLGLREGQCPLAFPFSLCLTDTIDLQGSHWPTLVNTLKWSAGSSLLPADHFLTLPALLDLLDLSCARCTYTGTFMSSIGFIEQL